MYVPHRQSILSRPVKSSKAGLANLENAEAEHEKEQLRIKARAERLASTEERLIRSFYGTELEKRTAWDEAQQDLQRHEQARQEQLAAERQREEAWLSQPQQVFVNSERPWTAQSSTYYISKREEDEARRRLQRDVAEQNRLLMQYRHLVGQQERDAEKEAIQRTVQAEDVWFNRGAVSERWIAPQHRVKHRVVVPPQFAPAPPPYHCDGEAGGAVPPPSRPSTAGPNPVPRRSAFWERESGQAAKSALCYDDVYARAEQAAAAGAGRRPGQQQVRGVQQASLSAAPTPRRAAQPQQAPQARQYPWSWDA